MKAHPTFEEFSEVIMGEWVKIDYELDHLESGSDMRFNGCLPERKRQERVYNVSSKK